MDVFSLAGTILTFIAIVGDNLSGGSHAGVLLNGPAALIVIGDTLTATLLQTPVNVLKRGLSILGWVSSPPCEDLSGGINRIVSWSMTARKEGLLGLESITDAEPDLYMHKSLQLLVDGAEPEVIRNILGVDLFIQESRDLQTAEVFESMGGYTPTIGTIDAVMGSIHVVGNPTDPAQLGSDIIAAFAATIYGVGFANLLLLPIGDKLKTLVPHQSCYHRMSLEGLLSIAEGESPRSIESRL